MYNKTFYLLSYGPLKDLMAVSKNVLLYILEKNYINKTFRSCFEKMFLFVKILCQP